MHLWMAMRQALTALDAVLRLHGRELGLSETEVMIVILLGELTTSPASQLAVFTGRPRQQIQRSLEAMGRREQVHTGKLPSGRVAAWALTEDGRDLYRRLAVRLATYEELAGGAPVLEPLALTLESMTNSLVNRRSGYGWRVQRPMVSRLDPNWDREMDDPEWWTILHSPLLPGAMDDENLLDA